MLLERNDELITAATVRYYLIDSVKASILILVVSPDYHDHKCFSIFYFQGFMEKKSRKSLLWRRGFNIGDLECVAF